MPNIKFTDQLECTASHGRLAVASQIFDEALSKSQEEINRATRCHYELGSFERSGLAEAAAAEVEVCGNPEVAVIHYLVEENNRSGVILQQVGADRTTQLLVLDGTLYVRYIQFAATGKKKILSVTSWMPAFVNNITFDQNTRLLKLWWTNTGIADVTLPLSATVTNDDGSRSYTTGFLSAHDREDIFSRLEAIEKRLTAAAE